MQRAEPEPIAQEIGEQFLAGGIREVARVAGLPGRRRHGSGDAAGGDTAEIIERPETVGVALDEVVIDRDDVARALGPAGEHRRDTGREGLAFAGGHLGEVTAMERESPDDLDGEWPHAELALRDLAHGGEGGDQAGLGRASSAAEGGAKFRDTIAEDGFREVFKFRGAALDLLGVAVEGGISRSAAAPRTDEAVHQRIEALERLGRGVAAGAAVVVRGDERAHI